MRLTLIPWATAMWAASLAYAQAATTSRVVDIPTRPGVTQRMVVTTPPDPKAALVLLAGGHGGLQISPNGSLAWGNGNFLVRTRQLFAEEGFLVAVVDAPSDRQESPYLNGFRQKTEHAADLKGVIAWAREQTRRPVWLVGTSRGTQSAAYVATQVTGPEGPDGLVLTSTILRDKKSRAVPEMPLGRLRIPVLVVHHEQDGCPVCPFEEVSALMENLGSVPRKKLLSFRGGESRGDPCEAFAYHGFNGLEREVVDEIATWIFKQ